MDNKGFFLLHRKIKDHWIWEDPKKFQWWIDIILLTNHTDKKIPFLDGFKEIKRGSFHTSELKLTNRWNTSRGTVRRFLKQLADDGMITVDKTANGTTIYVTNYEQYQGFGRSKQNQTVQLNVQQKDNERYNEEYNQQYTTKELNTLKELNNVVVEPNRNNDFADVIGLYQSEIQVTPPHTVINKLSDDFDMFGKDIMIYAIKKSALAGNRDYRFIDYLTKEWRKQQLKTLEAVEQYEDERNKPKQSYNYNNDRNAVTNKFADRPDLSFQALEIKKGKGGLASLTDEERKAYESYYL